MLTGKTVIPLLAATLPDWMKLHFWSPRGAEPNPLLILLGLQSDNQLEDSRSIPLHKDNATIVRERIYLDKADPNVLRNEVTVIDNALTRPWTVTKSYRREPNPRPYWREVNCAVKMKKGRRMS